MASLNDLLDAHPHAVRFAVVVVVLAMVPLATRVLRRVLRRIVRNRLLLPRVGGAPVDDPRRLQRQTTVATLVESLARYLVAGAAIVIATIIVSPGAFRTVFGASMLVIVVGFGLQRLLQDVVAGTLLLFEGHIGVGDYIFVHQIAAEGIVEEFSLRNTRLRTRDGNTIIVMNSAMQGITRYPEPPISDGGEAG